MALYEHIFLARQDITSQQAEQLVEHYKEILEEHGGKVVRFENWGLRPLVYRIKKNRKAYYTLMNINASADAVSEMERQMRLSEDVLRFLTIRVARHEDMPSAMMLRRDHRVGDDRKNGDDDGRLLRRKFSRNENNKGTETIRIQQNND